MNNHQPPTTPPATPIQTATDPTCEELLARLRASFGRGLGDPEYDATVDFNNDGLVNVVDAAMFKRRCPALAKEQIP